MDVAREKREESQTKADDSATIDRSEHLVPFSNTLLHGLGLNLHCNSVKVPIRRGRVWRVQIYQGDPRFTDKIILAMKYSSCDTL